MERPYQFTDDRDGARSPFNQQLLNPVTQPPGTSFKTNVNRSKTRKWAEAKNYSYDGDDWGGYDPYDEYGSYDDKQDAPQPAVDPRRNSFEAGEEVRNFSSGQQLPQQPPPPPAHTTPTKPQPLQPGPQPQQDFGVRRDFSQIAHVPPPLKTNNSPNVVRERFPARKSSLQSSLPSSPAQPSQQQPVEQPVSPSLGASTAGKPLPFIRPADIYRRMEEERLREQETKNQVGAPAARHEEHQAPALQTPSQVRDVGLGLAGTEPEGQSTSASLGSSLPAVNRVASGFGSEFWSASELSSQLSGTDTLSPTTTNTEPAPPAEINSLEDASHELHNAVNQAFERRDDLSVPPTPISRDNSQSGHISDTAGISPIMSRVPSAATAEAKARLADNMAMRPIAEESSLPGSPGSRPSSQQQINSKKRSPTHSRQVSAESLSNSPARTPQLEYMKRLSTPMSAESTSLQDEEAASPTGLPTKPLPIASVRVIAPSADYSRRESDIAADASSSSPNDTAEAAKAARAQFLQTHNERVESPAIGSPVDRTPSPVSRRGSPNPSRVRDLADKYNDMHTLSRSSSAMSFGSQKSDSMSLKRSGTFESTTSDTGNAIGGETVVESIEQPSPDRPDPTRGLSFRPHLPGEWVSYAPTPSTEVPVAQEATRRSFDTTEAAQPDVSTPRQETFQTTEDFDPTPLTAKQPLAHKDIQPKESSPVDAVRNAGEALGAALFSSFGQNHGTRDFAQPKPQSPERDLSDSELTGPRPSVGDVYLRPLMVDRQASSIASSVAPTPPAKDTPDGLNLQRSSGYFPPPTLRVNSDAMSPAVSDYSPADLESDRLRREIERSLTPQMHTEDQQSDQDALDAPATLREIQKAEGVSAADHQPTTNLPAVTSEPDASLRTLQPASSGLLGKRFSFEKDQGMSGLWGEPGEESKRASYERPLSGMGLHVVNTNMSSSSSSESSASSIRDIPAEAIEEPAGPSLQAVLSLPSPPLPPTVEFPSEARKSIEEQSLPVPHVETENPLAPTTTTSTSARIPTVREIMALKSVDERINTYNSSREQIASMDTGLSNWLTSTLSSHPEHAHVVTDVSKPASTNAVGSIRYKAQPGNIMKMARKGLSGVTNREPSGSHASDPSQTASTVERQNSNVAGRSPSAQHGGVEKMQTKGKDLLHSAGMFGGKATVGAKGLFARAKGRLREGGSEKASGRASISNAALASPTSPNVVDDRSNKANNRFSTAFGRFGGSSTAERSSSQPASAVQSPMEGPEAIVPTIVEQQSALPSSGPDAYIAPWTEEKVGGALDDKDLVNERFKRIGLLPSPAFGGSMASRESNENIKAAGENDDPISKVEGAVHPEETNVEQNSEAAKAITPIALPEPAAPVEEITASDLPSEVPASVSDNAQPLPGTKEILPEHSVRVVNTSNINRSPTRRPVPQQTVAEVQPSSRRSSVSSLHRDDNDVAESSIPLQRSSPVEMQGPWQNGQSNFAMAPGPFAGPAAMYAQPSTMSSEQIIYEEPVDRTFSPTIMDPRQHDSEYQLPGVGPPPELTQGSRRSRFSIRSPGHGPVQAERINPNAIALNHQRTFSGDEVPLTQSAQEKREKRRSGMFSALSRGSSFSGLSGMNSDGRQSRGNDVGQAIAQPQAPVQQGSAVQKARETSGEKNKRFSRLGSIFGRSNSEAKKTNKLVKSMPKPERIPEAAAAPRTQNMPPQNIPAPPMGMGYGMENGMQQPQQWGEHPDQQSSVPAPPGGWYAPTSRRSSYHQDQQASLPQIQPTMSGQSWQSGQPPQQPQSPVMQPTRRLHSEGYRHEPRYAPPSDYRSMSPSPLRGQRGSQQYDTTTPQNYQRAPSWSGGPRQQPPPGNRNFSWGSMDQQQQQQQPGYYSQNTMAGSPSRQSPAGTPTHSRNASFGSMTNIQAAAPPLFRNPSSGALQRSSSPSMYGASQPYQVPMPAPTEAQLMSKQQQDWYPRYAVGSPGPPQQASTPGMYTRGYSNSRPGSANANNVAFDNIPEAEYARPGSAGGMMMPPPQSPGRSQQRRYYANGAAAMGPRPYPSAPSQPQQGEWQGIYRDV
ncbi:unnamed protein product [Aureobasidium pullulans]|nr:unnamed protein product [Aureobasidium pullulans]